MTEPTAISRLLAIRQCLDQILDAAPEAREQYLRELPDIAVADVVREMLASDPNLHSGDAEHEPDSCAAPGWPERFGPFKVIDIIGHGGMGTVFLAERDQGGFEQRVAIKTIRYGFGSPELHARFERERRILATLDHPNIARMIDGGLHTSSDANAQKAHSLPWYAMEYVEGRSLDAHVREHKLDQRIILALIKKVALAVQYAHQQLIVHRDLKPTNILVGAQGEPKLLDFGIAKLTSDQDAITQSRTPLTLAYAAPEQLRGETVGAAADIYSLGAILYELLCGERPFAARGKRSGAAALVDIQAPTEAPAPSQVLRQHAADKATRARAAKMEGDLDTIVLKAIMPEPGKRYATAQAFADDLQAFLAHRPIQARPPSWHYRAAKWVGRNRLSASIGMLLLASIAISGVLLVQQRNEALAQAQRADATKRFMINVFNSANRWTSGREVTARELALKGLDTVRGSLLDQPEARIEMYGVLAYTLARTDAVTDAARARRMQIEEMRQLGGYDNATWVRELLELAQHEWWAEEVDAAEAVIVDLQSNYQLREVDRITVQSLRSAMAAHRGDINAVANWQNRSDAELVTMATRVKPEEYDSVFLNPPYRAVMQLLPSVTQQNGVAVEQTLLELLQSSDRLLETTDINRGGFMMYAAMALAEWTDHPRAQAVVARTQAWLEAHFGISHGFTRAIPIARLARLYRNGDLPAAAQQYAILHLQRLQGATVFRQDCRDIEAIGGLIALAEGELGIADQRLQTAASCVQAFDGQHWQSPHARSIAAAQAYLAWRQQRAPIQALDDITKQQQAHDDGGLAQSLLWRAEADLIEQQPLLARKRLEQAIHWHQSRRWPYPKALTDLAARLQVQPAAITEPNLQPILDIAERLLADAERSHAKRTRAMP